MSLTLIPSPAFLAAPTADRLSTEARAFPAAGVSPCGDAATAEVLPGEFGKLFDGLVLADAPVTTATAPGPTVVAPAPSTPAPLSVPIAVESAAGTLAGSNVLPALASGYDPDVVAAVPLFFGHLFDPTRRAEIPNADAAHAPRHAHRLGITWQEPQETGHHTATYVSGPHLIQPDDTPGLPLDLVLEPQADVGRPTDTDAGYGAARVLLPDAVDLTPASASASAPASAPAPVPVPADRGVQSLLRHQEWPTLPYSPTPPLAQSATPNLPRAKPDQPQPITGLGHGARDAGGTPVEPLPILAKAATSQPAGAAATPQTAVPPDPKDPRDTATRPGLALPPEVPEQSGLRPTENHIHGPNPPVLGTGTLPDRQPQRVPTAPLSHTPPAAAEHPKPTPGVELLNRAQPIRAADLADNIRQRPAPDLAGPLPAAGQPAPARQPAASAAIAAPHQTVTRAWGETGQPTQFGISSGDPASLQSTAAQGQHPGAAFRLAATAPSDHPGRAQARHVATQLAQAVQSQQTGTTDITLNPKELGHVKLSLQAVDGTMFVAIAAERPETADLMRRHIDSLVQEFRALGFQDVSFSFSGRQGSGNAGQPPDPNFGAGPNPDQRQPPQDHHDTGGDQPADRFIPRRTASQTGGSGLDLRL